MIEVVSAERCVTCDICIKVCPTDVLYVAPLAGPAPPGSQHTDEQALSAAGALGAYRKVIGWSSGRSSGSRRDHNHIFRDGIR